MPRPVGKSKYTGHATTGAFATTITDPTGRKFYKVPMVAKPRDGKTVAIHSRSHMDYSIIKTRSISFVTFVTREGEPNDDPTHSGRLQSYDVLARVKIIGDMPEGIGFVTHNVRNHIPVIRGEVIEIIAQ